MFKAGKDLRLAGQCELGEIQTADFLLS